MATYKRAGVRLAEMAGGYATRAEATNVFLTKSKNTTTECAATAHSTIKHLWALKTN